MREAVIASSPWRAEPRTIDPTCAQQVPIPPPTSATETAIAASGPLAIVANSPTKPAAIMRGPMTSAPRARPPASRALGQGGRRPGQGLPSVEVPGGSSGDPVEDLKEQGEVHAARAWSTSR